jgi:hypothetical protein
VACPPYWIFAVNAMITFRWIARVIMPSLTLLSRKKPSLIYCNTTGNVNDSVERI